ncbi:uncharacterized protein [Pseudochaenichthys georgianus]|uniref:uncharacterized protein isoform X2 n=1 Tax=Pseudochaenichthys georgianus TaxID=52239 RepID=UPI00146B0A03|nr:uncharacterized protein LOC117442398 isoform X2 [Pseudochaenichthys georgianus]
MGQGPSLQEKQLAQLELLSEGLFTSKHWHGIGIDSSLLSYSGLNSTDVLVRYRDQLFNDEESLDVPSAVERIGGALAGFTTVPNAVGLGALIISMILESIGEKTMGTAEMLQRVFADEKAKENSMLVDGQMHSMLLKQWVNGAAFHTQMLIHQARLEGADGSSAVRAAGVYQQQLNVIMDRYKNYLIGITSIRSRCIPHVPTRCYLYFNEEQLPRHEAAGCYMEYDLCITETELVEHLFLKHQITWTKSYFSDLAANIPTLVRQHATFQI